MTKLDEDAEFLAAMYQSDDEVEETPKALGVQQIASLEASPSRAVVNINGTSVEVATASYVRRLELQIERMSREMARMAATIRNQKTILSAQNADMRDMRRDVDNKWDRRD